MTWNWLPAIMPVILYNGERGWTASHLVSVKSLAVSKIKNSNTLIDNILLADKKNTRKAWDREKNTELVRRIRAMEISDLNEWITWFSNVIRELSEEEKKEFIHQLREGDEKAVCSSFERIMKKEKAEDVIELLEDIGEISATLKNHIMSQTDIVVLKGWLKAAARAASIEEFERAAGLAQMR